MKILDFFLNEMDSASKKYQNEANKKINQIERDVRHKESSKMSREQIQSGIERIENVRDRIDSQCEKGRASTAAMSDLISSISSLKNNVSSGEKILGKTVSEWDKEWVYIGYLKNCNLTPYNHCVGLYRHTIDGDTKYVGRAIELNNGGFRKRLSDYRRPNDSARKHTSGQTINQNLDDIETYILVVGNDQKAVEATRRLEGAFINKYNPPWNKQLNL